MRKHYTVLFAFFTVVSLSGCASNTGTQSVNDFGRYLQLEKSKSEKKTVYDLFGQPHDVQYITEKGESVWQYYNIRERTNFSTYVPYVGLFTGGSDVDYARADFYFDKNGVFQKTERVEKSRYKNMWAGMGGAISGTDQIVDRVDAELQAQKLPYDKALARKNAVNFKTLVN